MKIKQGERVFELMSATKVRQLVHELTNNKIKSLQMENTLFRRKIRRLEEEVKVLRGRRF